MQSAPPRLHLNGLIGGLDYRSTAHMLRHQVFLPGWSYSMPGSIKVSVLEAFDLPATIADGDDVAIKVAVGTREYQTALSKAIGGKTTPWNLDFVFPVLNLRRDNLLVVLLDENGEAISKNEIDTPSIVEQCQGSFDVHLSRSSCLRKRSVEGLT